MPQKPGVPSHRVIAVSRLGGDLKAINRMAVLGGLLTLIVAAPAHGFDLRDELANYSKQLERARYVTASGRFATELADHSPACSFATPPVSRTRSAPGVPCAAIPASWTSRTARASFGR